MLFYISARRAGKQSEAKAKKHSRATEKFLVHEEYLSPIWNDTRFEYMPRSSHDKGREMFVKSVVGCFERDAERILRYDLQI